MRISLLQQREPFAEIVEATLSEFWSERYDRSVNVRWYDKRPSRFEGQVWFCNPYLNAIFVKNAAGSVLDPIRREFSRSLVAWRRPLQKAYVRLAAGSAFSPWLARGWMDVSPRIPDAHHQLIVAGNHKIRILDSKQACVFGILKAGFDPSFFANEIKARQMAVELGIPTPRLEESSLAGNWFREQFISGTPINRLADRACAALIVAEVAQRLRRLVETTTKTESIGDYVSDVNSRIADAVKAHRLLAASHGERIENASAQLTERILADGANSWLTTATVHGDFQPANILVRDQNSWLIDWEYSSRRQSGYDLLVYALRSRFAEGLAQRVQTWVSQAVLPDFAGIAWPGTLTDDGCTHWDTSAGRRRSAHLFFLEELDLHTRENANPRFTQVGRGLSLLLDEVEAWLKTQEAPQSISLSC